MTNLSFQETLELPPGLNRSAAIVAWFQGLYEAQGQPPPVLVGGGEEAEALDAETLRSLASRSQVLGGLERLKEFAHSLGDREPDTEEIERWSEEIPR